MKKVKGLPKNERSREKLLEGGGEFLSDQELLAKISNQKIHRINR